MDKNLRHFLEKTPYAKNYGTELINYEPDIECLMWQYIHAPTLCEVEGRF